MVRIAVVLLVDPAGRILLMERDEFAPRAANKWGMVGGHVEDGEDFAVAVHRELAEETGLTEQDIALWEHTTFTYSDLDEPFDYQVWAGPTQATDRDIVVGEGRQIIFVEPQKIPSLDLAESCAWFVPRFLASDRYLTLREVAS